MKLIITSFLLFTQSVVQSRVLNLNGTESPYEVAQPASAKAIWDKKNPITARNGFVRVCSENTVRSGEREWRYIVKEGPIWKIRDASEPPVNLLQICAKKGKLLYDQMLAKKGPKPLADVAPGTKLHDLYEAKEGIQGPLAYEFGAPVHKSDQYYKLQTHSKGNAEMAYQNEYNPKEGIIIGDINYGELDKNGDAGLNWSELAWQQYKLVADTHFGKNVKNLHYIVRKNIANVETNWILLQASNEILNKGHDTPYLKQNLEGDDKHQFELLPTTFDRRTHEMLVHAILGTDNGQGAAFIVKDHAGEIGKFNINNIYIDRSEKKNNIIIEIDP